MGSSHSFRCLTLLALLALAQSYVQFAPVQVPQDDESKVSVVSSKKVTYGQYTTHTFNKIARTAESHNCIIPTCPLFGTLLSIQQTNVTAYDHDTLENIMLTPPNGRKGGNLPSRNQIALSHSPSGGILMEEYETDTWFMMYQFEYPNPGMVYRVRMRLENDTDLAFKLVVPVSFSTSGGLWKPRAATLTPQNTYLGTEGTGPDALYLEALKCLYDKKSSDCLYNIDEEMFFDILDFMRFYGRDPESLMKEGKLSVPASEGIPGLLPYRFGYPFHISFSVGLNDRVVDDTKKLYALGRTGAHGIATMQNGQTIYMSGGKGGFFRFDDKIGDYESGELFAAIIKPKYDVQSGSNVIIKKGDVFSLDWVSLGERTNADLAEFVSANSTMAFSDIMAYGTPAAGQCDGELILVSVGEYQECLGVYEPALAGAFEPERYAALLGATMSVFKFSEITTRLDSTKFYIGVERIIGGSLSIGKGSKGDDYVTVTPNKCGCVFEVDIDDDYKALQMTAIACGVEIDDEENQCSTENVANPRSLAFLSQFEALVIGEASPYRANNFLWSYDYETTDMTRIFHTSREGMITSVNWYPDAVGGNNYIGITIATPFDRFAWMGYFGSFDFTYTEALSFSVVPVPYAPGPKELPIGFSRITGGQSEVFGGFKPLISTGEEISTSGKSTIIFGQLLDSDLKPLKLYKQGPVRPEITDDEEIVHRLGYSSLISTCERVYSVNSIDSIPSVSYILGIDVVSKKEEAGELTVSYADIIDWSNFGGLWRSGSGIITPWNTHLSGEIFEPDGLDYMGYPCLSGFSSCFKSRAEQAFQESLLFVRYFGKYLDDFENDFNALAKYFNPYKYGYAYEVQLNKQGCVVPNKLLTLGRFSHGDVTIMPDSQTIYMTDLTEGRAVGGGLFKFVASKAGDLSAGSLYAAKFASDNDSLDQYKIEWIELSSASNSDLLKLVDTISFNDMFDYIPMTKTCRLQQVNVRSNVECLEVKQGMEVAAAFFETRRYAATKGASIELGNLKGIVYDPNSSKVFISISRITEKEKIMLQDDNEGSTNHIKLQQSECGSIYSFVANDKFDLVYMDKVYTGSSEAGLSETNICSIELVASPGQLTVIPGHNTLMVAEETCTYDTSGAVCTHENAALWSMDISNTAELTRMMTVPWFSTISSPTWHANLNDNAYISANINKLYDSMQTIHDPNSPQAMFGYMGPLMNENADARATSSKVENKCYEVTDKAAQCSSSQNY